MAVQFSFYPDHHMNLYFRETINTPAGRNEIRSMIGGTNLGLGSIMFAGALFPKYQALSFVAVGIVGVSIGGTRLLFLGKDRPHTNFNRLDAVVEPLGGLVLLYIGTQLNEV